MSNQLIQNSSVISSQLKSSLPLFSVGSVISVFYKIIEGGKERVQVFKGVVTNRTGGSSLTATFTVVKESVGAIKITRVFPLHSPKIVKIEVHVLQRARHANITKMAVKRKDITKKNSKFGISFKKVKDKSVNKDVDIVTKQKKAAETEA